MYISDSNHYWGDSFSSDGLCLVASGDLYLDSYLDFLILVVY